MDSLQKAVRVVWFYLGLAVLSLGFALVIRADVGAAPWDIFHLGIAGQTGLPYGLTVQASGLVIILLNLALHIKPSLGMVLNMLSVGPMVQVVMAQLPLPDSLAGRWLMLIAGVLISGIGTALYVSADLGSGPRDGLMIGLTRRLGWPVAVIKNSMDLIAAVTGWLLGGPIGLGSLVVALTLGPSVQFGMSLMERLARLRPFSAFVRPVALKRS